MSNNKKRSKILIIGPAPVSGVKTNLEKQYGFAVSHVVRGEAGLNRLQRSEPDLIVLNVKVAGPPATVLLQDFQRLHMSKPVVLIGANGETHVADFDYPHIIGWITPPFTVAELAALIESALERPLADHRLVLAKRTELIDANRRLAGRVQELQTLFEIGKSIASELDRDKVLRLIAEAAVSLAKADESYLLLHRKVDDALILCAAANIETTTAQNHFEALTEAAARRVVASGQALRLAQDDGSTERLGLALAAFALLNVPIMLQHKVIGVLGVNNQRLQPFTVEDEKLLTGLADYAAIAIKNAQLYEDTKALSRDLRLVNEVSRLVSSTFDVQEIPRLLLQRTAEIVGAECGSLALLDKTRDGVVFQLAYDGEGNELKGLRDFLMPLGAGIVGHVAQTGHPVIANDVSQHPHWSPLSDQMTGFITRSLVAVPLIAEGEILGVVELVNKLEGAFTQSDVDLLSLVAASTATAIQNARQYAELERAHRALHEAHEQRVAAERWAVLGKAAANLAHRINNTTAIIPIAAVHTSELLKQVELPAEIRQDIESDLDRIRRNSLYTVEIASVLLRRFRKQPTDAHNVNTLVEKALSLVEFPANVRVVKHLDPNLPEVDTSNLLVDVFVELFSNATRAISPQGGILRVATFSSGNRSVSIQITDNGPGIASGDIDKIFEMFFTTHDSGLGFGLWWVKTFVEQQHGEVTVESKPGEFTTFTITLPQQQPSLRSQAK